MRHRLEIQATVYEGDKIIGNQGLGVDLPDTEDLASAHLVLGEGQLNFGKLGEQVAIMAVWDAGRVLNKRLQDLDDQVFNDKKAQEDEPAKPQIVPDIDS